MTRVTTGEEVVRPDHGETHEVLDPIRDQNRRLLLRHLKHAVMGADVHPAVGRVDPDPMDMAEAPCRLLRGVSTITGLSRLPQQQRSDNEQHERGYREPAAAGRAASNGSCRAVAGGGLMHNIRSCGRGPPRQLLYR